MALHDDVLVQADTWTPISSGSIGTAVRIQNFGNSPVVIQGTATDDEPSGAGEFAGAIRIPGGSGERIDVAEDFAGVAGCAFLWAHSDALASLSVSHG